MNKAYDYCRTKLLLKAHTFLKICILILKSSRRNVPEYVRFEMLGILGFNEVGLELPHFFFLICDRSFSELRIFHISAVTMTISRWKFKNVLSIISSNQGVKFST